ncbi:MAG: hypothetical protein IH594_17740, partial [Bacteroidales bacterium]|nr:hypothetical protein [Bacteroidales bacterium]
MNISFRRIITIVLLAGLVTVLILGFLWLKINFTQKLSPQQAIPGDFVICLESNNFKRLGSAIHRKSSIWTEFQVYNNIAELDEHLRKIDSLTGLYPDLNRLFEGDVFISVHLLEGSYSALFALGSPENSATDQILKLLSNEAGIEKEKYENATCYHLDFGQSFPSSLSFAETRGVFLLSPNKELLKKSIRHLNGGEDIFKTQEYGRLKATSGSDVEAHIFVNFSLLEDFAGKLLLSEGLPHFSALGAAAALDMEIKPDQLVLNGFSSMTDTVFQQFSALSDQKPVEQKLFSVIPGSAFYLEWIGLSDPVTFSTALESLYPDEGENLREFRQGFYSFFNGQVAEIRLKEGDAGKIRDMIIVSVKSSGIAEDFLKENLVLTSGLEELASEKIPTGENAFIYAHKIAVKGLVKLLFGNFFAELEPEWFCFFDNFLILGNSPADLKEFLYQNSLGKTLENDTYFQNLKENFSSRSNYFVYVDPSRAYPDILKLLQPEAGKIMKESPESWRKLNAAGFQSTVAGDLNYFRIFVNYSGQVREYAQTIWERKLNGKLILKPAIMVNHETGEKEIFIQDENNTIYLIGNRGELLWQQKVDSKILSEIYQVDYYRNGKLQYFFNTENRIYLIDRNGNHVGNYPVELREKASAGLALLDYDNNKDYRVPVPTVGKDILMYDRHGKIVPGWNFRRSDHIISFPLAHYRVGDKDYIVARDEFRLYILDRRGRIRLRPEKQIDFSAGNPLHFVPRTGNSAPRLIASDKKGNLHAFYFDGKVEMIAEHSMGEGHYFLPADLNGDGNYENIFTDSTVLKVFNSENRLLFSTSYAEEISLRPFIYNYSSREKKNGIVLPGSG